MINLHRLNGNCLVLNCDLIKYAEATPDTTLTLVTGEKLIVRESCDELTAQVVAYRSLVLSGAGPEAAHALAARFALNHATQPA